ncbi:MAG: Large exoprotein involved in heme utilization or adhesion, partial [Micavibrio sp.]|nr:Large exoprotein involved in heme utilization or adhesion [Micavibrio sp.]
MAGHNKINRKKFLAASALALTTAMITIPGAANADDSHAWVLQNGGGSFSTDVSLPNTTTITQTSDRAIGIGNTSIGLEQSVNILQNGAGSLFVAKDNTGNASAILGRLSANGQVFVLNENGVIFGKDAVINVGSIVAATGDLTHDEIMSGTSTADLAELLKSRSVAGYVINQGTINIAEGGLAALIGPYVSNDGVINAKMGKVSLTSTGDQDTLDLYGDGLIEFAVGDAKKVKALVENNGVINAAGGTVIMNATAAKHVVDATINMSGVIRASSVTESGGKIVLNGGSSGKVSVTGKLDASGAKGGGSIDVRGHDIDVSETAELNVDAGDHGNGGQSIVFADNLGIINGRISARGGLLSGNGGFIETSGGDLGIGENAEINAYAYNGEAGTWLLDPKSIAIVDPTFFGPDYAVYLAYGTLGFQTVSSKVISNALSVASGANVVVTVGGSTSGNNYGSSGASGNQEGDIRVGSSITKTGAGTSSLTLNASDDIIVENGADIKATSGKLDLNFNATGTNTIPFIDGIIIGSDSDLATNGGNVNFTTPSGTYVSGTINAAGGNININNGGIFNGNANSLKTQGSGTISLRQNAILGVGGSINNVIDALNNTGSGMNTITVGAGVYALDVSGVNVNENNVTLKGAKAGLAGNTSGRNGVLNESSIGLGGIAVSGNNVTVDGFGIGASAVGVSVTGANDAVKNNYIGLSTNGITATGASNLTVTQNNILALAGNAITLTNVYGGSVDHNTIGAVTGNGVQLKGGKFINIDDNTITGALSDGIAILALDAAHGVTNVNVRRNTLTGTGANGINVDGADSLNHNILVDSNIISATAGDSINVNRTFYVDVTNNTILGSFANGIDITNSVGDNITNNTVTGAAAYGIHLTGGDGSIATTISGNKVTGSVGDGIHADNTSNFKVTGNTLDLIGGNAISIDKTSSAAIDGNHVLAAIKNGILSDNSTFSTITNNDIKAVGGSGVRLNGAFFVNVDDNIITGAAADGIFLNALDDSHALTNVNVRRNTVTGTGANGINMQSIGWAMNHDVLIDGNKVSGTVADGINVTRAFYVDVNNNIVTLAGGNGINLTNSIGIDVGGNTVTGAAKNGIYLTGYNDIQTTITNNKVNASVGDGIRAYDTSKFTIAGNTLDLIAGNAISVETTANASITGNHVLAAAKDGIQLKNVQDTTVADND